MIPRIEYWKLSQKLLRQSRNIQTIAPNQAMNVRVAARLKSSSLSLFVQSVLVPM